MIRNRDIINALKSLRHDPKFSAVTKEQTEASYQALMARVGITDFSPAVYTWRDYVEFYRSRFQQTVLHPALVALSILLVVAGGWMTSVSAADDSVPGDLLYSIKRANEQARLTLAMSDHARAELHMEFAGRRLEEVSTISTSQSEDKAERMKSAVAAFKSEVSEVKNVMQTLQSMEAVQIASALDVKTDQYTVIIAQTATQISTETPEVSFDVASAQQDVEAIADAAVDVLVSNAEEQPQTPVQEDLQQSFKKKVSSIDNRLKLTLGRIDVIKRVANDSTTVTLTGEQWGSLNGAVNSLRHVDDEIDQVMNLFAAGGYRKAFEGLDAQETIIHNAESVVAEIELDIVTQKSESVIDQNT